MPGMPSFEALLLLASVIALIVATQWRTFHPFFALIFIATAFGYAAGLSTSLVGKAFGSGFSQAIYSPGLVIVAAGLIAGLADSTGAMERLAALLGGRQWLPPLIGLVAGAGTVPASAFALATPLLRAIGGTQQTQERDAVALGLALSASHGLLLFAPVPIAAASILDADWGRVALFGVPLAIVLAACAAAWARWWPAAEAAPTPPPRAQQGSAWSALVLILAIAVPLLMLIEQSLGDIPSEPLGGGSSRELVIGLGRPLILFVVGVGVMIIGLLPQSLKFLGDRTWSGRTLGDTAGIVLTVGAAGGLQRLCQETGMAELLGERFLAWHVASPLALLVPFLIAATVKTLQGSSLVAAITAAGMVQPVLVALGLGDGTGKALATLAIGAGAMTVSHINDEFFWVVADRAGLSPLAALGKIGIGTLLLGLIAVAALMILAMLTGATLT